MSVVELIRARKRNLLHIDGYLYYSANEEVLKTYWICIKRKKCNCPARAVTYNYNTNVFIEKGPDESSHNHKPDANLVEKAKLEAVNRSKTVAESCEPCDEAILQILKSMPLEVLPGMYCNAVIVESGNIFLNIFLNRRFLTFVFEK